ncbi:helix-turn-helix transcriptional regulator [Phyllobacterium myrsinacearum]|uniref:Helix-turn-helix domain-containing protein n=1 Tax=Phyllobacterium myrsinacearum TaxID=28101 RepID=A0A839EMI2_9HYPH|nr:helix-turn-helix domain-containing protein [Phyllobacterium myrsinacearum]MBA8877880.1 hypothetical protein [Phyllobacterium myrsinacearum]
MTPAEGAIYLHLSASTLARWRTYGGGPLYLKLGKKIFYRKSDLDQFIVEATRSKTRG